MQKMVTIIPPKEETIKPEEREKKRVAAYLRVSSNSAEQEESLDNMNKHFTELLNSNPEWENVGIYVDDGISGLTTKKRDGFNAMMAAAKAHKIDIILVKSISRFARNTVTTLESIRKLSSYGTTVIFQKENLVSSDPQTEFILSIMASMAQQESLSISQNTTMGFQYKMARGEYTLAYGKFLGYDKGEDGKLVINPEQAKTVRRIFELFLSGYTLIEVVHKLEEEGHKTGTGNTSWTKTGVKRILENEKYYGAALLQKTYTKDVINKHRVMNDGARRSYFIENDHDPIIDKQTFYLAQGELKRRSNIFFGDEEMGKNVRQKKNDFTRKVICPKCGSFLTRVYSKGISRWRCAGREHGKCDFDIIREDVLQEAVVAAAQELWDKRPECIMKEVPQLNYGDSDEKLVEAAGINNDNAFMRRTKELLDGDRPEGFYPELVRYHIDRIEVSERNFIVHFHGDHTIRVPRSAKKHTGRSLRRR